MKNKENKIEKRKSTGKSITVSSRKFEIKMKTNKSEVEILELVLSNMIVLVLGLLCLILAISLMSKDSSFYSSVITLQS